MKKSHRHIARLPSFSIMGEIIPSKVKCTNISEVEASDWQQAKRPFLCWIHKLQTRRVETSAGSAFSLSLPWIRPKFLSRRGRFCRSCWISEILETWKPNTKSTLQHNAQPRTFEYTRNLFPVFYQRCNTETIKYQLMVQYASAVCFPRNLWGCGMCCPGWR